MSKKFFGRYPTKTNLEETEFDLSKLKSKSSEEVVNRNGFKNDSIYCYLNAVIQALLGVHPLAACFARPELLEGKRDLAG